MPYPPLIRPLARLLPRLIVAAPQKDLVQSGVLDATPEEREFFADQRRGAFTTTIVTSDYNRFAMAIYPAELRPGNPDAFVGYRNSAVSLFPERNAARGEGVKETFVTYQLSDENDVIDADHTLNALYDQLDMRGVKGYEVQEQIVNTYFPRFTIDQISPAAGSSAAPMPWAVQDFNVANQYRAWHIGSSVSMESVLDVVNYNDWLLAQFAKQ